MLVRIRMRARARVCVCESGRGKCLTDVGKGEARHRQSVLEGEAGFVPSLSILLLSLSYPL